MWTERTAELAKWARAHLVNRTDGFGCYSSTGRAWTEKRPLTDEILVDHFAGRRTVGLHTTSPENMCRWCCWDLDAHDSVDCGDSNMATALGIVTRVHAQGLTAILEDSDGRGGLHIWVVFEEPITAISAFDWIRSISTDGEQFPKQRALSCKGWGNYVRLPGKHHKRDHWSRFYVDGQWYEHGDAVEWLLDQIGSPVDSIPTVELPKPSEVVSYETLEAADSKGRHSPRGEGTQSLAADGINDYLIALRALQTIPASMTSDYDSWLRVGMALHSVSDSPDMCSAWDRWSQRCPEKYQPGVCAEKWQSFNNDASDLVDSSDRRGERLGIGSLIHWSSGLSPELAVRGVEGGHEPLDARSQQEAADNAVVMLSDNTSMPLHEKMKLLADILGIRIDRVIQRGDEYRDETLALVIEGREVTIGPTAKLMNYNEVRNAIVFATSKVVRVSRKNWDKVASLLFQVREVISIDEDTSAGVVRQILAEYLEDLPVSVRADHQPEDVKESVSDAMPFRRSGLFYVHVPSLLRWCRQNHVRFEQPYKRLSAVGWQSRVMWGNDHCVRYWFVPIDSISAPPL